MTKCVVTKCVWTKCVLTMCGDKVCGDKVCVDKCVVTKCGGGRRRRRRRRSPGYRIKNKNPTQRCGEIDAKIQLEPKNKTSKKKNNPKTSKKSPRDLQVLLLPRHHRRLRVLPRLLAPHGARPGPRCWRPSAPLEAALLSSCMAVVMTPLGDPVKSM